MDVILKTCIAVGVFMTVLTIVIILLVSGKIDNGKAILLLGAVLAFDCLIVFTKIGEMQAGPFKMKGLQQDADKIKDETIKEITDEAARQSESMRLLTTNANDTRGKLEASIERADEMEQQLQETARKAEPPNISLKGVENIVRTEEGVQLIFMFECSKGEDCVLQVDLKVALPVDSKARILDVSRGNQGLYERSISDNGLSASMSYMTRGHPRMKLIVSELTSIEITGNYGIGRVEWHPPNDVPPVTDPNS